MPGTIRTVAPLVACLTVLAGCGGSSSPEPTPKSAAGTARAKRTVTTEAAPHLSARVDAHLPQPVSGEALLDGAGRLLVLGGLNSADESTDQIVSFTPGAGSQRAGSLAEAKHDLAAAALAGRELVFGGGGATELDTVEEVSAGLSARTVGSLPAPRSDLAAITVGAAAYVLGGYDGSQPLAEVLRTSDGRRFTPTATLPIGVRYPAVAALGTTIYLLGGELASGQDTDAIQAVETTTGRARVVARLPLALSHACAVAFGTRIVLLGGRAGSSPRDGMLEYVPSSKRVRAAGSLPLAVMDAAAAGSGQTAYLVGGIGADGSTLDSIIAIHG